MDGATYESGSSVCAETALKHILVLSLKKYSFKRNLSNLSFTHHTYNKSLVVENNSKVEENLANAI